MRRSTCSRSWIAPPTIRPSIARASQEHQPLFHVRNRDREQLSDDQEWQRPCRRDCGSASSRSEEHTSALPVTNAHLVCRLLLEKKKSSIALLRERQISEKTTSDI